MIKLFVDLGTRAQYKATRQRGLLVGSTGAARELGTTLVPERSYWGLVARTNVQGESRWLSCCAADVHEPLGQIGGGPGALLQDPATRDPGGA